MKLSRTDLYRIDGRWFKAFLAVAEHRNFTIAADHIGMSQSVISQYIKRLERELNEKLFHRSNRLSQETTLTRTGASLFQFLTDQTNRFTNFLDHIKEDNSAAGGQIRIALPPGYESTRLFRKISNIVQQTSMAEIKIELVPHEDTFNAIKNSGFHFGLTANRIEHSTFVYHEVIKDDYIAASSKKFDFRDLTLEQILKLRVVYYPGIEHYADLWLKCWLPQYPTLSINSFRHAGEVCTMTGALLMVTEGIGFSFFPRYCVENLLNPKALKSIYHSGRMVQLTPLYLVHLKSLHPTRYLSILFDHLLRTDMSANESLEEAEV